jgi:hypothetical protein
LYLTLPGAHCICRFGFYSTSLRLRFYLLVYTVTLLKSTLALITKNSYIQKETPCTTDFHLLASRKKRPGWKKN